jgi:Tfp pilus assembly protein PilN
VITKLNLASKPFRNRTLPYVTALLLLAFAVAGAIFGFTELKNIAAENDIVKKDIEAMQETVAALNKKGEEVQQTLTPEQKSLMIAAHKLVASKSFGWSRLFADLEAVLPGSVSASRISVQNIFKDGDRIKAELDFGVLSRDYQSVMQLIANMNNSGVFQAELRGQDLQKTDRITYTEYTLHIIYAPRVYLPANQASENPSDLAQQGGTE